MRTVFINLIGVPLHLYWDAVLKALVNFFSITLEDLMIKILPGENARIILVITRDDVLHKTTIGELFGEHPELLVAEKFERCKFGRCTGDSERNYNDKQKLSMLNQVFHRSNTLKGDTPALHKGELYWVFLTEANAVTVTVTDIAEEWERLTP